MNGKLARRADWASRRRRRKDRLKLSSVVQLGRTRVDEMPSGGHLQDSRLSNRSEEISFTLPANGRVRRNPLRMYVDWVWADQRLTRVQLASLIFLVWTAVGAFLGVPEMLKGFYWY